MTPVPEVMVPLALHIESISSKTITCKPASSPFSFWSFSALVNKSLIFFSVSPTNLSNNSGPFTTLNSATFKALAKVLAIRVLPVPGGPYNNIPFT